MKEDRLCKIERFMLLKPPTFSYSKDPLDADDWLKLIETKLDVTSCTDEECVALAVHQLEGTARSWWDNYCNSHADRAHITRNEFTRVFRDHYIPRQLLIQKAQEFRTMTQGTMTHARFLRRRACAATCNCCHPPELSSSIRLGIRV